MSGKRSRTKGHSWERKLAKDFQRLTVWLGYVRIHQWEEARRQLEYHEDDARGIDLQGTEPFAVQAKAHTNYVSVNTIKEIQCDENQIPLLITKGDHKEPMAVLSWKNLKKIIAAVDIKDLQESLTKEE